MKFAFSYLQPTSFSNHLDLILTSERLNWFETNEFFTKTPPIKSALYQHLNKLKADLKYYFQKYRIKFKSISNLRFLFLLGFCYYSLPTQSQILYDTATQEVVLEVIDHIYNQEFSDIEPLARKIRSKYPNHPVNSMLKAMQLQWQYLPVKDNRSVVGQYMDLLQDCIQKAKVLEKDPKTRPEAAFFSMAGHGYIALIHNYNDDKIKAASEAKQAYNYVMDGFKYMERNPEFYFSSGLYNYYIIRYPDDHPIVKPIVYFFKNGSMETGLRQMEIASKRGVFTRTESAYYLARILLKHEIRYTQAIGHLAALAKQYPNNPVFLMKYTENLLLLGQYDEAMAALDRLKKMHRPFLPIAIRTFEGLIEEKHHKNDHEAEKVYLSVLRLPADDEYTKEYRAFAYAGLGRIAARANDRKKAFIYYKKVQEIAEYKGLLSEAKAFLK